MCFLALLAGVAGLRAEEYPAPVEADYIIRDFRFASGETLPEVRMHYRTWGQPVRDDQGVVRNAVLILHGTTGSGTQFMRAEFAGELFGKGQLLDTTRYFIIIPDNLGHGKSSKPSDGLRTHFPKYGYRDMIEVQRRLLTEGLGVNHLRLIFGTSMGGMHVWLWGQTHPDFMDALMALASLPTQISGRNRVWRRLIIDAIRTDPEWKDGNYQTQPRGLRVALEMSWLMGNNPVQRLKEAPTLAKADEVLERYLAERLPKVDANDYLYAFEASHDYDPGPGLEKIKAPMLAINFADDLINPPELGILESQIKRVKRGKAVLIPLSDDTRGHGTHTLAPVWKSYLTKFLKQTETRENQLPSRRQQTNLLMTPGASELNRQAPERFLVRMETSKGEISRKNFPRLDFIRRATITDIPPASSRLTSGAQTAQRGEAATETERFRPGRSARDPAVAGGAGKSQSPLDFVAAAAGTAALRQVGENPRRLRTGWAIALQGRIDDTFADAFPNITQTKPERSP